MYSIDAQASREERFAIETLWKNAVAEKTQTLTHPIACVIGVVRSYETEYVYWDRCVAVFTGGHFSRLSIATSEVEPLDDLPLDIEYLIRDVLAWVAKEEASGDIDLFQIHNGVRIECFDFANCGGPSGGYPSAVWPLMRRLLCWCDCVPSDGPGKCRHQWIFGEAP